MYQIRPKFTIFLSLLKYLQGINAMCDLMLSGFFFVAITDGRHTGNDTANFNIQSAGHETTEPFWPGAGSTGVYIPNNWCEEQIAAGSVSLKEFSYFLVLDKCIGTSPVVHVRIASWLLVSRLAASCLFYRSKEDSILRHCFFWECD